MPATMATIARFSVRVQRWLKPSADRLLAIADPPERRTVQTRRAAVASDSKPAAQK
jgi:hypothetical protein